MTQSVATLQPGCPGHLLRSGRNSPAPWLCDHTQEPTVLSRVSYRPAPEFRPFSPALPVTLAHPSLPQKHGWLWGRGQVRTVILVPRGDHLPLRAARFFLLVRLTGGFCHGDWTVPRQDVDSPFPLCVCHPPIKGVCTHAGSGPSRARRRLSWPPV